MEMKEERSDELCSGVNPGTPKTKQQKKEARKQSASWRAHAHR
jgi:hypothetical protein